MRILLIGACGFVGSSLVRHWKEADPAVEIVGIDNFLRSGSERNRESLAEMGVTLRHGDVRQRGDLDIQGDFDWVIDAAANPSVLAGIGGGESSRTLIDHNLMGTINLLEFCRERSAGFILLSTSRVYSVPPLARMPVEVVGKRFAPDGEPNIEGFTLEGVGEGFSTEPPCSLYGSSKRASEQLALEYAAVFGFPVWINRCGVLAGAGQFGKADQGIFAFWLHSWKENKPLSYIGFDGLGHQVRDCLHPRDLANLLAKQLRETGRDKPRIVNVSGGIQSALSLAQLSKWCAERWETREIPSDPNRRKFDLPWIVLDHQLATESWDWNPEIDVTTILSEIAAFADRQQDWIGFSR